MGRDREVSKIGPCLLLGILLLLALAAGSASATCDSPVYSHRTGSAKAWLAKRLKNKNVATLNSARWSQLGRVTGFRRSEGPMLVDDFASASDEFVRWLHGGIDSLRLQNLSITPMERPGFKSEENVKWGGELVTESTLILASFATRALKGGDTILDLPLDSCLSDAVTSEATRSLQEAPWEVRLASKLLHERAKGSGSRWASSIKALPEFVFLPLFFTDLELSNIQDASVLEEVHKMRRFIETSFQSLTAEEAAGAKFKEFAWAMAIVYSSAHKVVRAKSPLHLLLPFVTSSSEPLATGVEKVKVELYSESLCPYCANFIVNYLNPFFNNGIIDIVDLRIIPYGNAHVYIDGTVVCQHGQDECDLNIIQTCAIRLWPKVTDWFPFIYCLEKLDRSTAAKNWKSCVQPSRLDLGPLLECSASPLGEKLEMEFAAETDRLQPPHKYVPWVLVNGEPLYESYEDVATYVCKAYQGNKPAVCSRLLSQKLEESQHAGV